MSDKILIENINQIIRTRRSTFTRQFVPGKQVPDAIIEQALENACYAPNHKLTEPWKFKVYCGEGLRTLAREQAAIYKENAGPSFKQSKYEQLLTAPLESSHIITIGCKRGTLPEMEEISAVACAVQNMYLTFTAYGIGGYWSTGGVTFMGPAKALAGLGDDDIFMGFFYVGYIQTPSPQRHPRDIAGAIEWVKE
jgi:nitroreductase